MPQYVINQTAIIIDNISVDIMIVTIILNIDFIGLIWKFVFHFLNL